MMFAPAGSCMGGRLVMNGTRNGGADSAVLAASRANQDAITLPPPVRVTQVRWDALILQCDS